MSLKRINIYSVRLPLKNGAKPKGPHEVFLQKDSLTYYYTVIMARNKDILIEYLKNVYGKDLYRQEVTYKQFGTLAVEHPSNVIELTQDQYDQLFKKKEDRH